MEKKDIFTIIYSLIILILTIVSLTQSIKVQGISDILSQQKIENNLLKKQLGIQNEQLIETSSILTQAIKNQSEQQIHTNQNEQIVNRIGKLVQQNSLQINELLTQSSILQEGIVIQSKSNNLLGQQVEILNSDIPQYINILNYFSSEFNKDYVRLRETFYDYSNAFRKHETCKNCKTQNETMELFNSVLEKIRYVRSNIKTLKGYIKTLENTQLNHYALMHEKLCEKLYEMHIEHDNIDFYKEFMNWDQLNVTTVDYLTKELTSEKNISN